MFDKKGNQRVPVSSLGDLLRACGQNPTLAEVDELVRGIKIDCELCILKFEGACSDSMPYADCFIVDFDSFLKILNRPNGFRDPGEPEEFVRGFQVFDKDMTGYVGVGELKYGEYETSGSSAGLCLSNRAAGIVLTSLGEKLTNEEVDELLKGMNIQGDQVNYTGNLTYPDI